MVLSGDDKTDKDHGIDTIRAVKGMLFSLPVFQTVIDSVLCLSDLVINISVPVSHWILSAGELFQKNWRKRHQVCMCECVCVWYVCSCIYACACYVH